MRWPQFKKGKNRIDWVWSDCETLNEQKLLIHMHRLGENGRRHVIIGVHASYQCGLTGFMTIQYGMDVEARFYVHNQRDIVTPFIVPVGQDVRVSLNNSYVPVQHSVTPALTVIGYTEDE